MSLLLLLVVSAGCRGPRAAGPGRVGAQGPPPAGVDVYIRGMACPFCTYNVEKKIREVPSVESVGTDLNTGIAHVEFEQGAEPDLAAVWKKVEASGFTPVKIVSPEGVYHGE